MYFDLKVIWEETPLRTIVLTHCPSWLLHKDPHFLNHRIPIQRSTKYLLPPTHPIQNEKNYQEFSYTNWKGSMAINTTPMNVLVYHPKNEKSTFWELSHRSNSRRPRCVAKPKCNNKNAEPNLRRKEKSNWIFGFFCSERKKESGTRLFFR